MHSITHTADHLNSISVPDRSGSWAVPCGAALRVDRSGVLKRPRKKQGGRKQANSVGEAGRGGFAVPSVNTLSSDDITLLRAARRPLQASSSSSSSSSWRFPTTLLLRASSENFCPFDSGRPSGDPLLVLQESSCSSSSSSSSSPSASSSSSCWSNLACWEYCFSAPQWETYSNSAPTTCVCSDNLFSLRQMVKTDQELTLVVIRSRKASWGEDKVGNEDQQL